tara:strand:- start:389 stop:523 length:135 start_codon:yes stop_codon:yes gene_type:complete
MSSGDGMRPESIDKGYLIDEKNAALRERFSPCAITAVVGCVYKT